MPRNKSERVPDWQYELVAFALKVEAWCQARRYSNCWKARDGLSVEASRNWSHNGQWIDCAREVLERYGRDAGPYSVSRVSG